MFQDNAVHCYPLNDLQPHATDGLPCPCGPTKETVEGGGVVMIHNSFDGREILEKAAEGAFNEGRN